ncbi:DUF1853 family protein [Litorivivens sp.]|uniref:DUF1853 family protein n=1 Tax=Litorivivens sp. TaxID=2020868 RepID=UPI0035650ADA
MTDFIHSLQHPRVRQLAWICFSEPLIANFSGLTDDSPHKVTAPAFQLHEGRRQWLRSLDQEPGPLLDYIDEHCKSRRLGLIFESYWHFFLKEDPDTTLLAHNLPVRDEGRTLGEFDVLYHCHRRDQSIHLELAIKFFMATLSPLAPGNALSYWLGPNSRDRLDIKWARMASHQLALPHRSASRAVLSNFGINSLAQEVAIKGWLFHHASGTPLHPNIHPEHPRGFWQHRSDFLQQENRASWRYLSKPAWLGDRDDSDKLTDKYLALAAERPVMVLSDNGERRMIAPDSWPASVLGNDSD